MTKKIILALALAAAIAAIAVPSFADFHSHAEETQGNYTCNMCKGTGRAGGTSNIRCIFCNGTGWNGSY